MKRQTVLRAIFDDVEEALPSVSLARDWKTIKRRSLNEGDRFYDTSLPLLDDALLEGLQIGICPRVNGVKMKGNLPSLLYPLFSRVFNKDGSLSETPDELAIIFIRQISRTYKKVFEVCDDKYVVEHHTMFVQTDRELNNKPPASSELIRCFDELFGHALRRYTPEGLRFGHGPGAVAEGYDSVQKYEFKHISNGILDEIDLGVFRPSYFSYIDRPPVEEIVPSRLVAVPKTATKPRLISVEPSTNQFVQQGLKSFLYDILNKTRTSGPQDQEPNQLLARVGSITGEWSTIDLSEASDRMSFQLIESLFKNYRIWKLLKSSRTAFIEIPGIGLHALVKFSSMGSAVNFALQIMVYTSIIYMLYKRKNLEHTINTAPFRVYGDDLIIPTDMVDDLEEELLRYGFKVNTNKSFSKGPFRESCGSDWFRGTLVSPVYMRRNPDQGKPKDSMVSLISFRNQLYHRALFSKTIGVIDRYLSRYGVSIYDCNEQCLDGVLCGTRNSGTRWNKKLQRTEIRRYTLREKREVVVASDDAKLMAALSFIGREQSSYDPLEWQSRPSRLVPAIEWTSIG